MFCRRAAYELADFSDAVKRTRPDALVVDVNCWGALSVADARDTPWACLSPYTPPLQSPGVLPFGLGLAPLSGVLGRARDAALRAHRDRHDGEGGTAARQQDSRERRYAAGRVGG